MHGLEPKRPTVSPVPANLAIGKPTEQVARVVGAAHLQRRYAPLAHSTTMPAGLTGYSGDRVRPVVFERLRQYAIDLPKRGTRRRKRTNGRTP